MDTAIPYGRSYVNIIIPDRYPVDWIETPQPSHAADPLQMVSAALDAPSGEFDLTEFNEARSVAIAINDKIRVTPYHTPPPLLERLYELRLPQSAFRLVIASGAQQPMPSEEHSLVLPEELLNRYQVISHDAYADNEPVYLDDSRPGTPLWTNIVFFHSDLKIVTGNNEPHQFFGFSGGVKSAAIGLASLLTIR